jgi:3-methyladenine DNA glycosylase/8-oxoguanine DNA glycosylase
MFDSAARARSSASSSPPRAAAAMYAKLEARFLTAIRGLGLWSAQLFLIFYLRRPDVVASGDLGIWGSAER